MIKLPDHLTIRTEHKHICNVDGLEVSCKEQTIKATCILIMLLTNSLTRLAFDMSSLLLFLLT